MLAYVESSFVRVCLHDGTTSGEGNVYSNILPAAGDVTPPSRDELL